MPGWQYVGPSDKRTILATHFNAQPGVTGAVDCTWDKTNLWLVDDSTMSATQKTWLGTQSEFVFSAGSVPPVRSNPSSANPDPYPQYDTNVEAIFAVHGSVEIATAGAAQTIPDPAVRPATLYDLSAAITFTLPTISKGAHFFLGIKQDTTARAMSFTGGTIKWAGGSAPTLTATAGKIDIFEFWSMDGLTWQAKIWGQNF